MSSAPICRFYQRGCCKYGRNCRFTHPPRINSNVVSPSVASSSSQATAEIPSDETCGICFDVVMKKPAQRDQTFGILPNCNHCFCFSCIIKWRRSKEFEADVSQACPECRVVSDFIYRSKVWFDKPENKSSFISSENNRMQSISCRFFNEGHGDCLNGNTCRYRHALENGMEVDIGSPQPRRRHSDNIYTEERLQQLIAHFNLDYEEPDTASEGYDDGSFYEDDSFDVMQYYDDLHEYDEYIQHTEDLDNILELL